jgi:membrane-associated protein
MSETVESPVSEGVPRSRWRTVDVLCGAGLAIGIIASYAFIVLTPSLLVHHGVLLEALAGTNAAVVSGGAHARIGHGSVLLVLLAPLCTVALYDVFFWWAGRLWGNKIVAFYTRGNPRAGRWVDFSERLVRRWGIWALAVAYYLPLPNVVIYVSTGISGMPLWTFLLGDIIGTLLWEGLLVGLGWAIGHPAVHVVNEIGHYSLLVTVALVVVLIGFGARRGRRAARSGVDGRSLDDGGE